LRNVFLREHTAQDIDGQVSKILHGLGHPEPPLNLNLVRELLKLDRQYYTSSNPGLLSDIANRLKIAGKQVLARPSLLSEAIRKWNLRALFLPDSRRILLDSDLPQAKQRWSEAHEIGHSIIPWHQETMMGDTKETLTPACHARIENEANYAAGQLLFLQKSFMKDARDVLPGINAIKALKERYGNTIVTTLWRYIEQSQEPLVGAISVHPYRLPYDFNLESPFHYYIRSRKFSEQFSEVRETDLFREIHQYCSDRRGGILGSAEIILQDNIGERHVFHFETFFNQYDALTLGVYKKQYSIIIPISL
jgi:hypothetical protein